MLLKTDMSYPLASVVPSPRLYSTRRIGIEIEMEDVNVVSKWDDITGNVTRTLEGAAVPVYWSLQDEPSLRPQGRGVEMIFAEPLGGADAIKAIEEIGVFMKRTCPTFSDRCGIHIHVDVRDMAPVEVTNLLFLVTVLAKPITQCFAPNREGNVFCVSNDEVAPVFNQRELEKYYAVNFKTVEDIGSVEFRMFNGTEDADEIISWVNTCLKVVEFTKNTDEDFFNLLCMDTTERNPRATLNEIFGGDHPILRIPQVDRVMLSTVRAAQDWYFIEMLDSLTKTVRREWLRYEGNVDGQEFEALLNYIEERI